MRQLGQEHDIFTNTVGRRHLLIKRNFLSKKVEHETDQVEQVKLLLKTTTNKRTNEKKNCTKHKEEYQDNEP